MSSSHCLGKGRESRRARVSLRGAVAPALANSNRSTNDRTTAVDDLFEAVRTQEYDQG